MEAQERGRGKSGAAEPESRSGSAVSPPGTGVTVARDTRAATSSRQGIGGLWEEQAMWEAAERLEEAREQGTEAAALLASSLVRETRGELPEDCAVGGRRTASVR